MKTAHRFTATVAIIVIAAWLFPRLDLANGQAGVGSAGSAATASCTDEEHAVSGDLAEKHAGASATGPSEIPAKGWWRVLKRTATGFSEDRLMTEAAGVTFYAILALFPAIASFISIYGLFADPARLTDQLQNLRSIVPGGGIDIIQDQVKALTSHRPQALGAGAIIGLATTLWSANAGMKSIFGALNAVYHQKEKRSFVRFTTTAFAFTAGAIVFIIIALLAVVAVPVILNFVGLSSGTEMLLDILRWPFMLVVLTVALALIYRYGPSRNTARWQWVSWGGAAAAILWLAASAGFSYYVAHFGTYNKTYGTLGAAIGFMTWIWISSMVVLLGAELNAELEQQTGRDSTVGPEKP